MGSLNPLQMISQIALAAVTGGTSMLLQAAMKAVLSAVGSQIIQQLGQALGLPQGIIDMAKTVFSSAMGGGQAGQQSVGQAVGNFAKTAGASPFDAGQMEKKIGSMINDMIKQAVAAASKENAAKAKNDTAKTEASANPTSKAGNFLQRIAEALGAAIDNEMNKMEKLSGQIQEQIGENQTLANNTAGEGADLANSNNQFTVGQNKLGSLNSQLQASSQLMNILSQVVSQVLKSVGEAESTIARKG